MKVGFGFWCAAPGCQMRSVLRSSKCFAHDTDANTGEDRSGPARMLPLAHDFDVVCSVGAPAAPSRSSHFLGAPTACPGLAAACKSEIVATQRVAAFAMGLTCSAGGKTVTPQGINSARYRFEMRGVYAFSVPAEMVDGETFRNRSDHELVNNTVSHDVAPPVVFPLGDSAIAVSIDRTIPQPASCSAVDLFHSPVKQRPRAQACQFRQPTFSRFRKRSPTVGDGPDPTNVLLAFPETELLPKVANYVDRDAEFRRQFLVRVGGEKLPKEHLVYHSRIVSSLFAKPLTTFGIAETVVSW